MGKGSGTCTQRPALAVTGPATGTATGAANSTTSPSIEQIASQPLTKELETVYPGMTKVMLDDPERVMRGLTNECRMNVAALSLYGARRVEGDAGELETLSRELGDDLPAAILRAQVARNIAILHAHEEVVDVPDDRSIWSETRRRENARMDDITKGFPQGFDDWVLRADISDDLEHQAREMLGRTLLILRGTVERLGESELSDVELAQCAEQLYFEQHRCKRLGWLLTEARLERAGRLSDSLKNRQERRRAKARSTLVKVERRRAIHAAEK